MENYIFYLGLGAPTTGNILDMGTCPLVPCGLGRAGRSCLWPRCPKAVPWPCAQSSCAEVICPRAGGYLFVSIRTTLVFANPFKTLPASAEQSLEQSLLQQSLWKGSSGGGGRSLNPCQVSILQSVSGLEQGRAVAAACLGTTGRLSLLWNTPAKASPCNFNNEQI